MDISSTRILGIRVDLVNLEKTVKIIDSFIRSRKPHQIVVVNVAKIIKARKNKFLYDVIEQADLVGADGVPVVWVSKLFGDSIPGRVNGTDLMEELIRLAETKGYRIYFFGAKQEVVEKVVNIYNKKCRNLIIAGYRNGYFSKDEEEKVALNIRDSKVDILFIGFGTPLKEYFSYKYKNIMNVPIIHGVGGSFDVVAGVTKRSPVWMQSIGLEWFYRLCQEPKRMWKRYLVTNTLFIILIIIELFKNFGKSK